MGWVGWTLVTVIFILPLALLCYSAITTSVEISRKSQPFVDSFFDVVYAVAFRRPRRGKASGKPNPD